MGSRSRQTPRRSTSRRDFLRAAGLHRGGRGRRWRPRIRGLPGRARQRRRRAHRAPWPTPIDPTSHPAFEHVVVLMGENRSFDNLLGWLYTARRPARRARPSRGSRSATTRTSRPTAPASRRTSTTVRPTGSCRARTPIPARSSRTSTRSCSTGSSRASNDRRATSRACPIRSTRRPPAPRPSMDGFVTDYEVNVRYLRRHEADARGDRADHGRLLAADAARALHPRARVRRVRPLARGGAVADLLQPLVLPRRNLARLRHEHATTAATRSGSNAAADADDLRAARGGRPRAGASTSTRMQLVSYTGILHAPTLEKFWKTDHFAHDGHVLRRMSTAARCPPTPSSSRA